MTVIIVARRYAPPASGSAEVFAPGSVTYGPLRVVGILTDHLTEGS